MSRLFSILMILAVASTAYGAIICGTISDSGMNAVEFASVRVSAADDSTFLKGATADSAGRYRIDGLKSGRYIVSASCIGYQMVSKNADVADSITTLDFMLPPQATELAEVTVQAERFIRTPNGLTVLPDKEQIRHSSTGYELIRSLMIPGISVNTAKGEVNAFGGMVAIYIDGMPADFREIQQLRPADVERIQYFDAPTGKYAGNNAAINIILSKRNSGGYVAADLKQRIGYSNGDYNLSSKIFRDNNQFSIYAGSDYAMLKGSETSRHEEIMFPESTVRRNYETDDSRTDRNSQYAQLRIRNKNDRRTLRATFNFVRDATPEEFNSSSLTYTGMEPQQISVNSTRTSRTRNFKYSLGLSGSFNLPHNQFLEASASITANRNHYDYTYTESSANIESSTLENYYSLTASLTYGMNFNHGNSLIFKASEYHNVSSANYFGSTQSWQHLWSSETLCFAEYMHPLLKNASVRVSPGISLQYYSLHGNKQVSFTGPRMQFVFTMQPARTQFMQLLALYGNSYPQLAMMTGATQQVDIIQQRRGNPDLKTSRILRLMAVYGIGVGNVTFQTVFLHNSASCLPVVSYSLENQTLVQSYLPDGKWNQFDASLSATWTPSQKFNLQISGGYLYNGYTKDADVSAACWNASAQASYYFGNFSVNAHVETPKKTAGYDLMTVKTPWNYGLSLSWVYKSLRLEAGADNPLSRHPSYRKHLVSPLYVMNERHHDAKDCQSAYIKVSWTFDFGKKLKHESVNVDRNIGSGILKAY